jgi:hypothetical protein
MTPAESREAIGSERWRRARGIMPRRPAQRPWLSLGNSRSIWYRRQQKARQALATAAVFDRLDWQLRVVQSHCTG